MKWIFEGNYVRKFRIRKNHPLTVGNKIISEIILSKSLSNETYMNNYR